ncbi:hypothetical protein ABIF63_005312 [Bradyrhizobium japonicum]|uniref:Uncharacterized protein n=1 Tax=Bradyrhizobium japonicum TaxID=375 RepID=A0ABV2RWA5_BRAJP
MKRAEERPYADPEAAARKLVELAANVEGVQDGRIYIERINAPVQAEREQHRVRRRAQARDRARLVVEARKRHLCENDAAQRRPAGSQIKGSSAESLGGTVPTCSSFRNAWWIFFPSERTV